MNRMARKKMEPRSLPAHIGIIMDGNGRWARKRALPRSAGHSAGAKAFKEIARYANQIGLRYLTVYAFSTENWKRPPEEVANIMNILRDYLKNTESFKEENIQVRFVGDIGVLDQDIIDLILKAESDSKNATGLQLNIALNYGGRDEILHAVKGLMREAKEGKAEPDQLDETMFSNRLYTYGQPDPDLIIRPSGEYRLSNFMIWQSAYAEFWFSDILWPDFKPKHLDEAIAAYQSRDRRYGGV